MQHSLLNITATKKEHGVRRQLHTCPDAILVRFKTACPNSTPNSHHTDEADRACCWWALPSHNATQKGNGGAAHSCKKLIMSGMLDVWWWSISGNSSQIKEKKKSLIFFGKNVLLSCEVAAAFWYHSLTEMCNNNAQFPVIKPYYVIGTQLRRRFTGHLRKCLFATSHKSLWGHFSLSTWSSGWPEHEHAAACVTNAWIMYHVRWSRGFVIISYIFMSASPTRDENMIVTSRTPLNKMAAQ